MAAEQSPQPQQPAAPSPVAGENDVDMSPANDDDMSPSLGPGDSPQNQSQPSTVRPVAEEAPATSSTTSATISPPEVSSPSTPSAPANPSTSMLAANGNSSGSAASGVPSDIQPPPPAATLPQRPLSQQGHPASLVRRDPPNNPTQDPTTDLNPIDYDADKQPGPAQPSATDNDIPSTQSTALNDKDAKLPMSTLLRKKSPASTIAAAVVLVERKVDEMLVLAKMPNWMTEHFNVFKGQQWGHEWAALLANWALLEGQKSFRSKPSPLPCPPRTKEERTAGLEKRPPLLSRWMKYARPAISQMGNRPMSKAPSTKPKSTAAKGIELPIEDADFVEFVNLWGVWWDFLQPEWRVRDGNQWSRKGPWKKQWGKLEAYGVNGWLSVVVCLWWWRRALEIRANSTDGEFASWKEAVVDALWILEGLRCQVEKDANDEADE
ncbi:hypothetical protein CYLTODRAFT_427788 [Cylindrobasidium torrendii FP15055 ss-10]|uniref:Uncharacterized protein n=1 Tax=Cylindrobasidium torrendii FP15055 ss-10 TaxID=1314674 RepID=A0A0D7ARV9_9AGAR|nr:hypothetical protein CYLTODRAFT_427788 [Cylindrobasidium torrendii FP15055 ss-10]